MRSASIPARLSAAVQSRALLVDREAGMTSAEYAVGTVDTVCHP